MKQYPVNPVPYPVFNEDDIVYIVAGGPSLRGFDWRRLEQKKVIAINKALYACPNALVLYWTDERIWHSHRQAIEGHSARFKITAYNYVYSVVYPSEIFTYKFTGMRGFDDSKAGLCHGNNAGYAAINLAVKLGAKTLVLLGYDFRYSSQGESHWHDGHFLSDGTRVSHREETLTKKMLPNFESLRVPLLQNRVTVYNANLDSRLNVWPKITVEEALDFTVAGSKNPPQ